jgi:hypothetical protein
VVDSAASANGYPHDEVISLTSDQIIAAAIHSPAEAQPVADAGDGDAVELDVDGDSIDAAVDDPTDHADTVVVLDDLDPEVANAILALRDHGVEGTDEELLVQARQELELRTKAASPAKTKRKFRLWGR